MRLVWHPLIALFAVLLVLGTTADAAAWGPATHVKLATDLLANLWMLPAGIATLLARHRRAFLYGNVATDTVLAKKMSRVKQLCHQWTTGFSLLESAETNEGRAFSYGYLAHLAADTVAHNQFLPRQMAVSRSTVTFGHLYWEIRADSQIRPESWAKLRRAIRADYPEPERLLRNHLRDTLLSFKANRVVFKQMNLLASERAWRRSVDVWSKLSRFDLSADLIRAYHDECKARILDLFEHGQNSVLLHEDPNGNAALSHAKAQRKLLLRMRRARIPDGVIRREAAESLGPTARTVRTQPIAVTPMEA